MPHLFGLPPCQVSLLCLRGHFYFGHQGTFLFWRDSLETDRAIGAAFTLSARSASTTNNADNAAAALRTAGLHTRLHRIEHLAAALSRWE